jgi:hypothetical protein
MNHNLPEASNTMASEIIHQESITQSTMVPKQEKLRAAHVLSAIVALVAAAASLICIGFPDVYRDKGWTEGAFGNDLVTLIMAVLVLAPAILWSARGSVRARLVWFGALYYMFYNFAFYIFGLPVTKLYLPWIAIFALSGSALALGMGNLDSEAIARRFSPRTPARWIAGYLFVAAVMVSFLWISLWVRFLASGQVPEINGSQEMYKVVAAVDLSFMVPLIIPGAYCLWTRRPWGYVLGAMISVQGAGYNAVMGLICLFGWMRKPESHLFSGWFINCVVGVILCLLCLAALLLNMKKPAEVN